MPDESEEDPVRGLIAILAGLAVLLVGFFSTISILERWQAGTVAAIAVGCAGILLALGLGACTTAAVSLAIAAVERRFGFHVFVWVAAAICGFSLAHLAYSIYESRSKTTLAYERVIALTVGPLLIAATAGAAKLWRSPRKTVQVGPWRNESLFWWMMLLLLIGDIVLYLASPDMAGSQRDWMIGEVWVPAVGGGNWLLIRYLGCSRAQAAGYSLLLLLIWSIVCSCAVPRY